MPIRTVHGTASVNIPVLALLVRLELILDHVDHDLVADQTALVHDLLGLPSQRCLLGNLRSQHVSRSLLKGEKWTD